MQIVYLSFGTFLTFVTIIQILAGQKYNYMTDNLDSGEYPFKSIYCIGFVWCNTKIMGLKGKLRDDLIEQAKLLFDPKFSEYYANVVWAQVLSFAQLSLTISLVLAGVMNSGLMVFIGVGVAVFFGYYFINRMNDMLKTRELECTAELPEIVSTLALLINAGMMLHKAWRNIADSKEGPVYKLMKDSCVDMDNGMSEVDAIHKFGKMTNSSEIRKFTSALAQSIERGSSELTEFLSRQTTEMWVLKKQIMLQKGEAAATKLLMPTVLLFVGIIIAVLSGAVGMLLI